MEIDNKEKMLVNKIDKGTVIDKIPAGKAIQILRILRIDENVENTVAIAIRVDSKSMKIKDILKIKNRMLSQEELKKIWLIAPKAKISLIDEYEVQKQYVLEDQDFSDEFEGVLTCNNPTCATNVNEPVTKKFLLMDRNPILVRCLYCDRVMVEKNIREQL